MAKNEDNAGKIDENPVDNDDQVAPTVINTKNERFFKISRNGQRLIVVDSLEKLVSKSTLEKLPLRRRPVAAAATQPNGREPAMQVNGINLGKPPLSPRWRVARPAGPPGTTVLRTGYNKTINIRSISAAHGSSEREARSMLPPRPRPPPGRQMDQSPWLPSPVPVPIFKRRPSLKVYTRPVNYATNSGHAKTRPTPRALESDQSTTPDAAGKKITVDGEKNCNKDMAEFVGELSLVVEISSKKAKLET